MATQHWDPQNLRGCEICLHFDEPGLAREAAVVLEERALRLVSARSEPEGPGCTAAYTTCQTTHYCTVCTIASVKLWNEIRASAGLGVEFGPCITNPMNFEKIWIFQEFLEF